MLRELPFAAIHEFWEQHPWPPGGSSVPAGPPYSHLMHSAATAPRHYVRAVLDALEPFLVSKGLQLGKVLDGLFSDPENGGMLPARGVLACIVKSITNYIEMDDAHLALLQALSRFHIDLGTGEGLHLLRSETAAGGGSLLLALGNEDKTGDAVRALEPALWPGRILQSAPRLFGLPAFDSIIPLADRRDITAIPWSDEGWIEGGEYRIRGELYGTVESYAAFLKARGLSAASLKADKRQTVVVVRRKYICPIRKRVVLQAGCAYGAPEALLELRYKRKRMKSGTCLAALITEALRSDYEGEAGVEERYRLFRGFLEGRAEFVYHRGAEAISLNGFHLVRGIPAKILRKVLEEYMASGRREFDFRAFKRDPSITANPKHSNFEVRLGRLRELFAARFPSVSLVLRERGRFFFDCRVEAAFRETE